ncbi:MAG: iron ABC transporter permease [Clostridia bacterium]|nr:iron ABC transporter permease [Clostridia bacterium]
MTAKEQAPDHSRGRRFKNRLRNTFTNPYNIITLIAVILLAYLILVPLIEMIKTTLTLARSDLRRVKGGTEGEFTWYYWNRLLFSDVSRNLFWIPLRNSLIIALSTSALSITMGSLIAWLMVRTDLPGKKFFSLAVIIPYMLPSWCKSMAWLTVFRNETIGGAAGFLSYLGIRSPDWLAYGPVAIIIVLSIHYYAYAYLLVSAALRSINSELEEMGEIVGAGRSLILRRITFPLVLPAILSSIILTFSKSMGTFGVPSFLGLKVGYYTISTSLYNTVQSQKGISFSISLVLILLASVNIFINQKLIGSRKSYATIGGKGARGTLIGLGGWKWPIVVVLSAFLLFAVVMPLLVLLYQTFMLKAGDYSLSNFTWHYWLGEADPNISDGLPGVFRSPQFWMFVKNTLLLVGLTSLIATLFGQMLGYINSRGRRLRSGKLVEQLVFIPYLIPSIAFGAMYLAMFATPTKVNVFGLDITLIPSLYGTFTILVLVSIVKHLPFASRAGTSNMLQISTELEEAGQLTGAGFVTRFLRIVFPLAKNGFMSGLMLILISIMKELDLIMILMTPSQATLPYMAYTYSTGGFQQPASAVAIVMFVMVFFFYWVANKFFDADIAGGLGG